MQATGRNFEQLYSVIDGLNSAAMDPVNMCYNLGKGMELERGGGGVGGRSQIKCRHRAKVSSHGSCTSTVL